MAVIYGPMQLCSSDRYVNEGILKAQVACVYVRNCRTINFEPRVIL